jgi:hypothetical protein
MLENSSSWGSSSSSSEDDWEEAEIVVNKQITNGDENERLEKEINLSIPIINSTDVIKTMEKKRDEREKKKKKKKYIVPGSSDDHAALHQVQVLFNLGRLRRENTICNNKRLQGTCLSSLPAGFISNLIELNSKKEGNNTINGATNITVKQLQMILSKYNNIMTHQKLPHPQNAPGMSIDRMVFVCKNRKGTSYELHLLFCAILRAFDIRSRIVGTINPISWRNNSRGQKGKKSKPNDTRRKKCNKAGSNSNSKKPRLSKAVSRNMTNALLLQSDLYTPSTWIEVYAITNGEAMQPHVQAELNRTKPGSKVINGKGSTGDTKKSNSICNLYDDGEKYGNSNSYDNVNDDTDVLVQYIKPRWVHIDCIRNVVDQPSSVEWLRPKNEDIIYVFAIDKLGNIIDVLDRYSFKPSTARKKQFPDNSRKNPFWLKGLLQQLNNNEAGITKEYREEQKELIALGNSERIPTSQVAFRKHPLYAIKSYLAKNEVIYKGTVVGYFKGNPVYRREDVKEVRSIEQWKKRCREVHENQLDNPIKIGTKRKRIMNGNSNNNNNNASSSSDEDRLRDLSSNKNKNIERIPLYGIWQTKLYIPPPVADGKIPRNSYGNWELWTRGHIPSGSVHLNYDKIELTCKTLGIEHVAVVNGFERKQGRVIPVKNGVLILKDMRSTVEEAHEAMRVEREKKKLLKRKRKAIRNWRRLMSCYKTKIYVDQMYDNSSSSDDDDTATAQNSNSNGSSSLSFPHKNPGKRIATLHTAAKKKKRKMVSKPTAINPKRSHTHKFDKTVELPDGRTEETCSICGFQRFVEEM